MLVPKLFLSFLISVYLFVSDNPVQAQTQEKVTVNTDHVTTWVQVTNRDNGVPIKGLGIDDFLLQEEGKSQLIDVVEKEQPLSVVLMVNGYPSEWSAEKWYRHIIEIMLELGGDVEIAVMGYDSITVLVQPLTKDINVLSDKLKSRWAFHYFLGRHLPERIAQWPPGEWVMPRIGDTTFTAAEYLIKAVAPARRKIIIFITERSFWTDETTINTGAEVEAFLEQWDITVYGLLHTNTTRVQDNDPLYNLFYRQKIKNRLKGGTLEGFIKATGGTSIIGQWEECDEMFMKLAKQIRSSYTIGYYPENTNFDGKFRRIKLELSKSGKAKFGKVDIKTREGYHAVRRVPASAPEKLK